MNPAEMEKLHSVCSLLAGQKLPRWNDLPDLDLYMDQLLSLVARYLKGYPGLDEKGLTASMVNNYVKLGLIPSPEKKKYKRHHLANLMMILLLKPVLPIGTVRQMIDDQLAAGSSYEDLYGHFCDLFEATNSAAAENAANLAGETLTESVLAAALRAQAEQAIAVSLYEST